MSVDAPIPLPPPGHVLNGRFEIDQPIGSGGMATVFRAFDRTNEQVVAIKMLHRATRGLDRFAREARVLASLEHPHVVSYVTDGTTEQGAPYLVMEWLDGQDLRDRLQQGPPLTEEEVLSLATRVTSALEAAHRQGIVHRDIKPGNLFLVNRALDQVKVLDFGIARLHGSLQRVTATGAMLGTPAYMAPEQARGRDEVDGRADLFSLGCVLFECLSGRPPFTGEHALAVVMKIALEDAPRIRHFRQDIAPGWDPVIAQLLARSPEERYATVQEAQHALATVTQSGSLAVGHAPGITQTEQRITSVVVAATALLLSETLVDDSDAFEESPADHALLIHAAHAHDARVERLADGTLVAFLAGQGLPTERAAQAARCALAMQAAAPHLPLVLATGRHITGPAHQLGDVIDRAVALLGSTTPGAPTVDEVSAGLLEGRFHLSREQARFRLGAEREIPRVSHRLLGRPTPCVGRDRELRQLRSLWQFCIEEPTASAALITGEAGMGKSRLAHELIALGPEEDACHTQILLGRADIMSAGTPFGMLAAPLRRTAGISRGEPASSARHKLRDRLRRHLSPTRADELAPFLGDIAGVPFDETAHPALRAARGDPTWMRDRLTAAWVEWVRSETAVNPMLLVLEDLQWGDLPSVQLVDAALRQLEGLPFLVLALARPEVGERFPRLWEGRDLTTLQLRPLRPKAQAQLARSVLGDDLSERRLEELLQQANGNAFFLEELLRAAARGDDETLPDTILGIVQTRLDALAVDIRQVLRAASVFGQTFWPGGLRAVLGSAGGEQNVHSALAQLVEEEWIDLAPGSAFATEPQYEFRHALVRESAYASLTGPDQVTGHRLAGTWLQSMGGGDALALADHFERGGLPGPAINWYARSAREALDGADPNAVIHRAERGIACGAQGTVLGTLRYLQAEAKVATASLEEALKHALEACGCFEPTRAAWNRAAGLILNVAGRLAQGETFDRWLERLRTIEPEEQDAQEERLLGLTNGLLHLVFLGRSEAAATLLADIETMAGDLSRWTPLLEGRLESVQFTVAMTRGELGTGIRHAQAAIAAFDRIGTPREALVPRIRLGWAYTEVGAYDEAEQVLRQAIATAHRLGQDGAAIYAQGNLGHTLTRLGRLKEAITQLEQVVTATIASGDKRAEAGIRGYLAMALWKDNALERADEELAQAYGLTSGYPPMRATVETGQAVVLLSAGRAEESVQKAASALRHVDTGGTMDALEALLRLTHVQGLLASGRQEEAIPALRTARARIDARSTRFGDEAHRHSFRTQVPENAETLSLADRLLNEDGARS